MPANQPASRRTTIAILLTLAVTLTLAVWNQVTAAAPAQPAGVVARRAPVSDVLAAPEQRGVPNSDIIDHAERPATPPLIEILRAADLLAQAHALPASTTEPPLIESLQAADQLAKAGLLPSPEPPLIEVLRAASILTEAGVLPAPTGEHEGEQARVGEPPRQDAPEPAPPAPTATPVPVIVPAPTTVPPPPPPPPAPEPTPPKQEATQPTGAGWYDDTFSSHLFGLVNEERAKAGVAPVSVEPRLTLAASRYAKVLSDNDWFSHTGPDGSTLVDRVEAAGFPFDVQVGEVLAWGNQGWGTADIVEAWLNSPSHREQILNGVYTRAGIGCYFTPAEGETVHCVMDFAG